MMSDAVIHCEYDDTAYDPDSDIGCPTCHAWFQEQLAEHAWMANANRGVAGMTYAEQMIDAGRGHLLREDER